jgi:hypothetical protein
VTPTDTKSTVLLKHHLKALRLPTVAAGEFEARVVLLSHLVDGAGEDFEPAEVVAGRERRHDVPVGGNQRRAHQEVEVWRRVDQHHVVAAAERVERFPETHPVLPPEILAVQVAVVLVGEELKHLVLEPGRHGRQCPVSRHHRDPAVEPALGSDGDARRRHLVEISVGEGVPLFTGDRIEIDAEVVRRVALGVGVDDARRVAEGRERGRGRDRAAGLPTTALLVRKDDDLCFPKSHRLQTLFPKKLTSLAPSIPVHRDAEQPPIFGVSLRPGAGVPVHRGTGDRPFTDNYWESRYTGTQRSTVAGDGLWVPRYTGMLH